MSQTNKRNSVLVDGSNNHEKVIYFMTKAFRIKNNYTLYQAKKFAEDNKKDLLVYMVEPYEENSKILDFFYNYSEDLFEKLHQFSDDIKMIKRDVNIEKILADVHTIFIDKSYLKFDIDFLTKLKKYALENDLTIIEVEVNVFVPITLASDKEEYGARTIRKKINDKLSDFQDEVLEDAQVSQGEKEALNRLQDFIDNKLDKYDEHNDPSKDLTSNLSPYLKFGFISPVTIYNLMKDIKSDSKEDFLEELIVRRELAYNFVYYNSNYDKFDGMTEKWAYQTMKKHKGDEREYLYTKEDYIHFKTHDPYFNAAMMEMIYLGKMHSYMRMYWAKKIIEWSKDYKEAYQTTLELNNYYFYDGLTPNSYTGVAWCYGKHDRAWFEREIFGKLRYMNANGLKRKFNIEDYVQKMKEVKGEKE
ncbi:MAG: deoxyribodipyrimidine photolyase [Candidatus Izemoplasmatales bacterium]